MLMLLDSKEIIHAMYSEEIFLMLKSVIGSKWQNPLRVILIYKLRFFGTKSTKKCFGNWHSNILF